jgi:DNA-binding NtrC family response regulator
VISKSFHLLLVDDNRSLVEALADVFETKGYRVDLAYDGLEAVERVRQTAYDCILMDIRMPGMNGVEAFKEIKKLSPATRVILMTAYSVQGLIDEALHEGALAVLDKPVGLHKVLGLLESLKGESSLLIVDEKPESSLLLTLQTKGYSVAVASTAAKALEIMAEKKHDAVLLNAEIRGLTNDDSIVLMREIDPKCIIIVMSADSDRPPNPYVYATLQKPFKVKEIVELLDRVFTT